MNSTVGRVYSLKKFNLSVLKPKDKLMIFFIILIIGGVISGAFLFSEKQGSGKLAQYLFKKYLLVHTDNKKYIIFFRMFVEFLIFDILLYVFGVSVIGVIIVPFLILFLGFSAGDMLSYIFYVYELKGIAFNSVIIIPPLIVFCISSLNTAKSCFAFSVNLSSIAIKRKNASHLFGEFSLLCKKMLIAISLCLVTALIDLILYETFGSYFKF